MLMASLSGLASPLSPLALAEVVPGKEDATGVTPPLVLLVLPNEKLNGHLLIIVDFSFPPRCHFECHHHKLLLFVHHIQKCHEYTSRLNF